MGAILALLAAGGGVTYLTHVERAVIRHAEWQSVVFAEVAAAHLETIHDVAQGASVDEATRERIAHLMQVGDIFRFKLFDEVGRLNFDTEDAQAKSGELAKHNAAALSVVTSGVPFTEVKDGGDKPNRPDFYSETYLPLLKNGRIAGVLEVYFDQTATRAVVMADYQVFGLIVMFLLAAAFGVPATALAMTLRETRKLQAKAEAANQAKSNFLATMSHEIRTPMNGVIGMSLLLSETELTERQKMLNEVVIKSGEQLLGVINDILDISKVDAGKLNFESRPFKLSRVVSEPLMMVARLAEEKRIELTVRVQPDLPRYVVGDLDRLRQVTVNLINNAVKFTPAGHVYVNLTGKTHTIDGVEMVALRMEVQDTGPGIPPDMQDRIFERFTQLDDSATRSHEGTGLGLAISRGLILQMGGRIGVEPAPGGGSIFWIELTLPAGAEVEERLTVAADVAGKRVLIVDDNEVNRFVLRELVQSWRMTENAASTGREAIEMIRRSAHAGRPYDVVILDQHMPGLGGDDVIAAVRGDPAMKDVGIVLLSSVDSSNAAPAEMSADQYLLKPVAASALFDALANALSNSSRRIAEAAPPAPPAPADAAPVASRAAPETGEIGVVLLVEDNVVNRLVAKQMLATLPLRVIEAHDGAEAVEAATLHRPDIVLMDVSMPVMNGYDATRLIRKREREDGVEPTLIVGVTAHAMAGDRARCIESGMDAYLPKPLDVERLRTLVSSRLAAASAVS
ncbi:MAG: response regulator [Pikeienuella sp.]|uniref:response regulator n=1 Tax=Pikeienuella sp. TaxID=2831957 RepID=UPI00391B60C9